MSKYCLFMMWSVWFEFVFQVSCFVVVHTSGDDLHCKWDNSICNISKSPITLSPLIVAGVSIDIFL